VKFVIVAVLAACGFVGCGDNIKVCSAADCPDSGPAIDGRADGAPRPTFAAFVHDQILNHTDSASDPVPFSTFATLVDEDADDHAHEAYADLFP